MSINAIKFIGLQEIINEQIFLNGKIDHTLADLLEKVGDALTDDELREVCDYYI